jgi:hypothetical protein
VETCDRVLKQQGNAARKIICRGNDEHVHWHKVTTLSARVVVKKGVVVLHGVRKLVPRKRQALLQANQVAALGATKCV